MKASVNSTLAATLIATFVGLGAWLSGLAKAIWPAHPQMAEGNRMANQFESFLLNQNCPIF
jgi:hypothetical protein